jgi:CheY-like chemotaxis protein
MSRTILLVEDEPALRLMVSELLADEGYEVLQAEEGRQALEVASRHDGPIHLLVSDLVMPRMGGRELAERLVAARPQTRVVFVSGYGADALPGGAGTNGWQVVSKPFAPAALVERIRAALG